MAINGSSYVRRYKKPHGSARVPNDEFTENGGKREARTTASIYFNDPRVPVSTKRHSQTRVLGYISLNKTTRRCTARQNHVLTVGFNGKKLSRLSTKKKEEKNE